MKKIITIDAAKVIYSSLYNQFTLNEDSFDQNEEGITIIPAYNDEEFLWIWNNAMEQMTLCLTDDCNLRCDYCVYCSKYKKDYNNKIMNFSVAKSAIDFFIKHSLHSEMRTIAFYGGEPLLCFNIIKQCVEYIKENYWEIKMDYSITTNAMLLNDEKINFFVENNFKLLISLDGPAVIHDRYRKNIDNKPTYETIIANKTY